MKERLSKFINVLKKDGLFKTIHKTYKYCMANYINKINFIRRLQFVVQKNDISRNIQSIIENETYDRIIIWRGSFGWNVPLYQRPQHIANQLSKKNCLILYEVTRMTDKTKFIDKYQDNLYLVNYEIKAFEKLLWEKLSKATKPKYLQLYSTCWDVSDDKVKEYVNNEFKLLYEYIDDLNPVLAGTKELPENVKNIHKYVCNNIDDALVITSADKLYEDILKKRKSPEKIILSTNGVEYEHFANVERKIPKNKLYQKIIKEGKPIIGYYGALASWFDYNLLKTLAIEKPNINIILIGIKYDTSFDESKIEELSNVYYLGPVNYKELANYASFFDVCIIPFLINEITVATNPLKVFEYMALGKPIVTTAINECKKYKSVFIAKSEEEFIHLIEKTIKLNKNEDAEYFEILRSEALRNTWDSKAKEIIELLEYAEKHN